MFVNKEFFSIVIILELFISGDRFALGRHLHRHSAHKHHPIIPDPSNVIPAYVEANDLANYEAEDPEVSAPAESGVVVLTDEHHQAQPEDFFFPPDLEGSHESVVELNGNELDHEIAVPAGEERNTLEDENAKDRSASPAATPSRSTQVPKFSNRHIIDAPLIVRECKEGERRDSIGKCRLVLMK